MHVLQTWFAQRCRCYKPGLHKDAGVTDLKRLSGEGVREEAVLILEQGLKQQRNDF